MCPQDSIGVFGNRLTDLPAAFDVWREVCRHIAIDEAVGRLTFDPRALGLTFHLTMPREALPTVAEMLAFARE